MKRVPLSRRRKGQMSLGKGENREHSSCQTWAILFLLKVAVNPSLIHICINEKLSIVFTGFGF